MKNAYRVWWSSAAVVASGLALAYWFSGSSVTAPQHIGGTDTTSGVAASGRCTASEAENGGSSTCNEDGQKMNSRPADLTVLRQDVASLKEEIVSLRRQIRDLRRAAPVAATENAENPTPDPLDPAVRAAAEQQRQEQMVMLEADFRREPIDRAWALQTTGAVQDALNSDAAGQAALQRLECHSRTCRVELAADDTGTLGKSLPLLMQQLAPILPNVMANTVDEENGGGMVLYLSSAEGESAQNNK